MLKEDRFCSEWAPKILARGPGKHPAPRATGQGPGPRGPPLSPAARQGPPRQEGLHRRVTVAFSCPSFLLLAGQTEWEKRSAPTPGFPGRARALCTQAGRPQAAPPRSAVSSSLPRRSYCLSQGQLHLLSLGQALISFAFNQSGATDGISGIRDLDGSGTVPV